MPTLEEVLEPKYKGAESDLFIILGIGYDAEDANQAALVAKNTKITALRLAGNRTKLAATILMPDEHTRGAIDSEFKLARSVEMSNVHGVFKTAMSYIEFGWPLEADFDIKMIQAGHSHFDKSTTNYGEALLLINALITFVTDNTIQMGLGGMPVGFGLTCSTAKTDLTDSETAYTGQVAISRSLTNEKMVKKNELYTDYQLTHTVAALVFEEVKATLDLFTYSAQYLIIHPPHPVKQEVGIKEITHKDIHNAVLLKDIKNLGAEVIYMYDLDQPVIDANKITFNSGDIKQNIYSKNLRFINLSTHNKGKMEVWREVHQ